MNKLYVKVILPLAVKELYTYSVPAEFTDICKVGSRTIVQFGKTKFYTAIIESVYKNLALPYETKDVLVVVDNTPTVSKHQLEFWKWIASYYMCTLGEVFKAALPSGLKIESRTTYVLNADKFANFRQNKTSLNADEETILSVLEKKNKLRPEQMKSKTEQKALIKTLNSLLKKGLIQTEQQILSKYKHRKEQFIRLHENLHAEEAINNAIAELKRAPKQLEVFLKFIDQSQVLEIEDNLYAGLQKSEFIKNNKFSYAVLKALEKKQLISTYDLEIGRLPENKSKLSAQKDLTKPQQNTYTQIKNQFQTKNTVLLHGVTSSGKTEIYIKLIDDYLKMGKQILYLLPEIAITSQIINRLKQVFGNAVGVYHSKFNDAERVEIWNKVAKNQNQNLSNADLEEYQIILGVRSSIFLPFSNLGLVIIDEEHENSYKQQEPSPRYNARDAAVFLASLFHAKTLLGTATPSIESYFNVKTGKYGLAELKSRFADIQLPEIEIIDRKKEFKKRKMKSHFSFDLIESIKQALKKKEQVILFQNRRGFSNYIQCRSCAWIPYCENCNVSLTYHKYSNYLSCHYCGYSTSIPSLCEECKSSELETVGYGTEKIEDEMANLYPQARVVRMDQDSTRSKKAYQTIIADFENQRTDILIGTQMISKGLDFDNVSMVGIVNADVLLNYPDFRANERSFQMLSQVSGRAGRKNKRGKVLIQTNEPKHPILKYVVENGYYQMFASEIEFRKRFYYPPFVRLIDITVKHKKIDVLNRASSELALLLRATFGNRVLGPEFPIINRLHGFYLKKILLKIEKNKSVSKAKQLLADIVEKFSAKKANQLFIVINVDPL